MEANFYILKKVEILFLLKILHSINLKMPTVCAANPSGLYCRATKQSLAYCDLPGRKRAWGPEGSVIVHTSKSGKWTLLTLTSETLMGKVIETYMVQL